MKSFFSAITALALAAVVSAQGSILSVTNPINGTVFTAGKPAIISWTHPTVDIISQIVLAHGDPSNLQQDGPIASNVSAAALSYTWNIPTDIAQGVYALIFGTSPNVAYSPQFIIQPADGTSSAASAAPISASVSASASVSSASASATIASSNVASASSSVRSNLASATSSSSVHASASAIQSAGSSSSNSSAAPIHNHPAAGIVALGMVALAVMLQG